MPSKMPSKALLTPPSSPPLVIGIVAGEVSGDSLGADFMQQMNNLRDDIVWVGVGGPKMQAQGLQSLFPLSRLAVMGLVEVVAQLSDLFKARRELLTAFMDAADTASLLVTLSGISKLVDIGSGDDSRTTRFSGVLLL